MTQTSEVRNKIQAELSRIEEDCTHTGKAHFNAASGWEKQNLQIGIPAVALSAVASTAFFTNWEIAAGLMTAFVAVLTSLQTFLKPSERAAAHKSAGDQYLGLRDDARVYREITLALEAEDHAAANGLDAFTKRRNELNLASPQFSQKDFEKARLGIRLGEAKHVINGGKL